MIHPAPAWRSRLLALAGGTGAALAHPPFGLLPGLLGYALMMHLADRAAGVKSAFLRGWLAGCAYFAISMWWVAEAFLVDVRQAWMAPFAVLLLATGLAPFWGAALALYRKIAPPGVLRVLVFAGALAGLEWLRGHVLTGLPWNLPGETWRAGSAPSQFASVVGAYGLTWITLAVFAAAAVWREGRAGRIAVGVALAALAGLYVHGAWRLSGAPGEDPRAPLVRIVQPDVRQAAKYDPELFAEIVRRYVRLTARPAAATPDIVIWPEGAIPASINEYLSPQAWTYSAIAGALKPGQTLLVGAYRVEGDDYYNSLIAVRAGEGTLEPVALYDKHRLVPFGEYIPLDGLASRLGIKQMVHVGDGFAAAGPPRPIAPPGIPPLQPLICYESLFPGFTRAGAKAADLAPAWIVNVSNDAWFGTTSGPLQHLNLASYRAIEEGLPLARATPTGVSAMIDSYGRIVPGARLGLREAGIIDVRLPAAAPVTPYRRWGILPFIIMVAVSLVVAGAGTGARLLNKL